MKHADGMDNGEIEQKKHLAYDDVHYTKGAHPLVNSYKCSHSYDSCVITAMACRKDVMGFLQVLDADKQAIITRLNQAYFNKVKQCSSIW